MSLSLNLQLPTPPGLPGLNFNIGIGGCRPGGANRPPSPCRSKKSSCKAGKGKGKGKAKKNCGGRRGQGPKSPQQMMMKLMSMMMSLMSRMQGGGGCCGGRGGQQGLNININQFRNPGFLA